MDDPLVYAKCSLGHAKSTQSPPPTTPDYDNKEDDDADTILITKRSNSVTYVGS